MSPHPQKYTATVSPEGKIEIDVPLPPGTQVEITVSPLEDADTEIIAAAAESLHFYDAPQEEGRKEA